MCLILFALDAHPRYPLVMAANRDEFYARKTAPAEFWREHPELLAGKDLEAGGTWMGITRQGRLAALTNLRGNRPVAVNPPSRGHLVRDFVLDGGDFVAFSAQLRQRAPAMNGFNLLFGEPRRLLFYSSVGNEFQALRPGIHGLSNDSLNSDWPKIHRGRALLREALRSAHPDQEELFTLLADRRVAPDAQLPDTGVGPEMERMLAPLFITGDAYGTKSSTLLLIRDDGEVWFSERSFEPRTTQVIGQRDYQFNYREHAE